MANKKNKKKIFLSSDNNYFIPLFTAIVSILENCSNNKILELLVFDGGIKEENKNKLTKYVKNRNSKITFLNVDKDKYSKGRVWGHFSIATYYRLEIPELEKKDKVIYLDVDLVLEEDILKFFNLNLKNKVIGATYDFTSKFSNKKEEFNSGVLIINCKKWNEKNYTKEILNYLKKEGNNLIWADQDVLNKVFKNNWFKLPLEWNRQRSIFDLTNKEMSLTKKEYKNLIEKPKIIHYVGAIKPWDYRYCFPDKKYYFKYRNKIDKGFRYANKSLKEFFYKNLRYLIYKFKLINLFRKINKNENNKF